MKPTIILAKHLKVLLMISLLVSASGATPSEQTPTTVGPLCNISWEKTSDQKVTGYQLIVIDQGRQAKQTVRFIPANTTTVSCRNGAPTIKDCGT